MENTTDSTQVNEQKIDVVELALKQLEENEENEILSTLKQRQDSLSQELDMASAQILVGQQDFTDYLNKDADATLKLVAFAIDTVSVAIVSFFVVSSMLLSLKASLPQVHSALFSNRLIELMVMTYLFNYFCYFTVLDGRKFSSLGKHFMNIKVIDEFGHELSTSQSFVRCLAALFTLGKGQDYFTQSRVVKA